MDDRTSERRTCEICSGPIRSNNTAGVCTTTAECRRERADRTRQAYEAKQRRDGRKKCKHPADCPNFAWAYDWCRMHWRRVDRDGDPGPVGRLKARAPRFSTGDVVGTWTVLEDYTGDGTVFPVRCECGTQRLVTADALLQWANKPCACGRKGKPLGRSMDKPAGCPVYLAAGSVHGRLTLREDAYYCNDKIACSCECGGETRTKAGLIKTGATKSCGCIQRERRITHGLSKHPLYHAWYSMVDRCTNPDSQSYSSYGARGVKVCERWLGVPGGLQNFIADMGPKPTPAHSLDRTDVDGNYEPGNCKWETAVVQALHRRKVAELTRERDALTATVTERAAEIAELRTELAGLRALELESPGDTPA